MKVSPALLSADFGHIAREVEMLNRSSCDMIHLDVMDGVLVPSISFGFPVIKAVSAVATKPLDVHLMIVRPEQYVSQVRDSGAALMNVHQEACVHLNRTIAEIKRAGMKAAVTLNPSTPVCMLEDVIGDLDMVLLMSVNPGFGGQKFIENTIAKVGRLKELIARTGSHAEIEIDGGVNAETAPRLAAAGADVLVAGSYVFGAENPEKVIDFLKGL